MPVDHSLALQAAIVAAVISDTDLDQLIAGRVYDYVPADPVFPFCRIGPLTAAPFEGDCIDGTEIRFILHGFTRDYGRAGAATLAAAIVSLFGRTTLSLGNGTFADIRAETWRVTEDTGEAGAWHATVNLTATTVG